MLAAVVIRRGEGCGRAFAGARLAAWQRVTACRGSGRKCVEKGALSGQGCLAACAVPPAPGTRRPPGCAHLAGLPSRHGALGHLDRCTAGHEMVELGGRAAGRRGTRACRRANPVVTLQPFTLVKVRCLAQPLTAPHAPEGCPMWCQRACSLSPGADKQHHLFFWQTTVQQARVASRQPEGCIEIDTSSKQCDASQASLYGVGSGSHQQTALLTAGVHLQSFGQSRVSEINSRIKALQDRGSQSADEASEPSASSQGSLKIARSCSHCL